MKTIKDKKKRNVCFSVHRLCLIVPLYFQFEIIPATESSKNVILQQNKDKGMIWLIVSLLCGIHVCIITMNEPSILLNFLNRRFGTGWIYYIFFFFSSQFTLFKVMNVKKTLRKLIHTNFSMINRRTIIDNVNQIRYGYAIHTIVDKMK